MAVLPRFDTPARLPEPSDADAAAWSKTIGAVFARYVDRFPQLYDPTVDDTPGDHQVVDIAWTAFPARLLRSATSEEGRWALADSDRRLQDEYCEWSVERAADGTIRRVTFTTEVPEYFDHVAERDPDRLLRTYRDLVGPDVELHHLLVDGSYQPDNPWNRTTDQRLAHLVQPNNTLGAAVDLVAKATVPREHNGRVITGKQELARCAGLGDPFRNSDPQIAAIVNSAAREGHEVTLLDPIGLYIDGLNTSGMHTPDGADPASFWTIERGDANHVLRARYQVPADRGYAVGHVTAAGRPIRFGAQLADRVTVRITGVVKPGGHAPQPRPCGG